MAGERLLVNCTSSFESCSFVWTGTITRRPHQESGLGHIADLCCMECSELIAESGSLTASGCSTASSDFWEGPAQTPLDQRLPLKRSLTTAGPIVKDSDIAYAIRRGVAIFQDVLLLLWLQEISACYRFQQHNHSFTSGSRLRDPFSPKR